MDKPLLHDFFLFFFRKIFFIERIFLKRPRNTVKKLTPILFRFDNFGYDLGIRSNTHLGSVNAMARPQHWCHRLIRTIAS